MIIAGAGTGKTSVITRRIAHLIVESQVKPEEILALTFTDKAAHEMQERVDVLVPYGFTDTWISTFHAFGDRALRENALDLGLSPDFRVLTLPETVVFFREHLFEFPLSYYRPLSDPTKFIEAMIKLFSRAKDEDIPYEEYLAFANKLQKKAKESQDTVLKEEAALQMELALCYQKFQELLNQEGKVDFGNQFYLTLELFRSHPRILSRYQSQFKYILVDEFQDTNYAQFEVVKLLAAKHQNLTVVADDDQSIYRWRGAAYSNLLNFIKDFPGAKKISLTQNYRSTQKILDSAYRLIQFNNPDRFEVKANIDKRLKGLKTRGKEVTHLHFDSVSAESDEVAKLIKEKVEKKEYSYQDFAILVRSNNDADPFLRSLNMQGIPWRFSGNQGLYSREEVRLCTSFLRLMANPSDSLSLYYLLSSPVYKISSLDLTRCMHYSNRRHIPLFKVLQDIEGIEDFADLSVGIKEKIKKAIKEIEEYIEAARNFTTGRLLYQFLTQTKYLKSLVHNPSLENEEKIKNLAKFFGLVSNFENAAREDRVLYFVHYLDMLINAGDDPATAEADFDTDAVNVLTIHKAKGLEFKVAFLVSLVMGRFPWPHRHDTLEPPVELIKDILPQGDFHIQEERRLFYVGMTRAKKELYLTSAQDYGGARERKVSCFILEALGKPPEDTIAQKAKPIEEIKRFAPVKETVKNPPAVIPGDEIINLSYYQIDDYLTCPLKYKYVHILRVPIMEHHSVLYGKALHDSVQQYFQNQMKGISMKEGELLEIFEQSFKPEGFFSREHLEGRKKAGIEALKKFFKTQEKINLVPKFIEKDFSFILGCDRIKGRWDRIDEIDNEISIIDFKSSDIKAQKEADKRTKESLQLAIYCLAYQNIYGKLPDWVELHFLESGIAGRLKPEGKRLEKAIEEVKEASKGIRRRDYAAHPKFLSCSYCAYNQICPFSLVQTR